MSVLSDAGRAGVDDPAAEENAVGQPGDSIEEKQAHVGQQQSPILQLSQHLISTLDLSKTMPHVARAAWQVAQADAARVVIVAGAGQRLAFGAGPLADDLAELDHHLVALAGEGAPSVVENLARRKDDPHYAPLAAHLGTVALWSLQVAGQQQGVLWLGYVEPRALAGDVLDTLESIANQAALAVANARAHAASQSGDERLAAILGGTPDPVLVVDRERKVSLLNHAAEALLGIRGDDALGRPVAEVLQLYPKLAQFFADRASLGEDAEWVSADGRTFSPRLSKVISGSGELSGWVLILRDITHFKLLNRNQAEFVRLVSHDLRSPLTYMQGFASLVSMIGELNERQLGFIEKIHSGIDQMTTLVDNIQDAGRWDPQTGFYEMSREPCDLAMMVRDVVSHHRDVAAKQGVEIIASVAPNIPIVNVDAIMVERALINLVSNAIKYSPHGGRVVVAVAVKDESVVFSVSDTGLGIAEEHLPLLFQRGGRIVTPEIKRNKIKGSGLGLFIVRSVARRHSGDAWAESVAGKGSTFFFNIPLSGENLIGGSR